MGRARKYTRAGIERLIRETVASPRPPEVTARLKDMGLPATPRLAEAFGAAANHLGTDAAAVAQLASVMMELFRSPDPTAATINFLRFVEVSGASRVFLNTAARGRPMREIIATLFGSSQYMADIVIRNPGYIYWLMEKRTWEERETVSTFTAQLLADLEHFQTVKAKLNAVRRSHRKLLLKIGARDLHGLQSIEETTAGLSDLAEATISVVLRILGEDDSQGGDDGIPGFAVLAAGKLGGRELNYSSDIDLVFVCCDAEDDAIANYHRMATRLTAALTDLSEEGYLYRVDLRLRPDGETGPMVNSLASMRLYYENRGKPWEFQAMLKARVVAGDDTVGKEFLNIISGLIYNPSLPYSPVEDIALMRTRIREHISAEARSFNIKLMEGGIRDIEFIVQTLQLLHGNTFTDLRTTNTTEGILRCHRRRLLKRWEKKALIDAYRFFRLVEHRLQMMHQIKTHSIPSSEEEIELLAARTSRGPLGTYSHDSFLAALTACLNQVRLLSDSFFAGEELPDAALLLVLPGDDPQAASILERCGFPDSRQAISVIHSLAYGSFPRLLDRTTRASFTRLLPLVLDEFSRMGEPGQALLNFSRIAAASRRESAFYSFLAESQAARQLIGRLAGMSSVLSSTLCRNLELLDTLLEDPRQLLDTEWDADIPREWFAAHKSAPVREKLLIELRKVLDRRLLAAWVVDDRNRLLPTQIRMTLSETVRALVVAAFEALVENTEHVALFALGSFGVGEPRLESDADLLVVTEGRIAETVSKKIQALNSIFTEGQLVTLDFRLRGEGASAPLVQDLEAYRQYVTSRMSTWERVAFAKCAPWAGSAALSGAYIEVLTSAIAHPFTRDEVASLLETRAKLESLVPPGGEAFETKRYRGGRYDIEYLTAVGAAEIVGDGEPYPFTANTAERLKSLASAGVLSHEESEALIEALLLYGRIDYLLELQDLPVPSTPRKTREISLYLERTFEIAGFPLDRGITSTLENSRQAVRSCYERVLHGAT